MFNKNYHGNIFIQIILKNTRKLLHISPLNIETKTKNITSMEKYYNKINNIIGTYS